jgi:hypothetical protein
VQAENISFRVLEPRGSFRAEHADVLDRLQARQVVVGELHAAPLKLANCGADVADLEAERRVFRLGSARPGKERDLGAAAAVRELAVGSRCTAFEPELLLVEAACALEGPSLAASL